MDFNPVISVVSTDTIIETIDPAIANGVVDMTNRFTHETDPTLFLDITKLGNLAVKSSTPNAGEDVTLTAREIQDYLYSRPAA